MCVAKEVASENDQRPLKHTKVVIRIHCLKVILLCFDGTILFICLL
jgi:hypothetical protein